MDSLSHLVIDIEWVSSYAGPLHPIQCQPFSVIECVSLSFMLCFQVGRHPFDNGRGSGTCLAQVQHNPVFVWRCVCGQFCLFEWRCVCVCLCEYVNLLLQGRLRLSKVADCPGINAIFGRCHTFELCWAQSKLKLEMEYVMQKCLIWFSFLVWNGRKFMATAIFWQSLYCNLWHSWAWVLLKLHLQQQHVARYHRLPMSLNFFMAAERLSLYRTGSALNST